MKPTVKFWDVETSLIQATTFTLRPDYLPHSGILSDWSILCGAWKVEGEDKVHSVKVTKYGDDKAVVQKLRDVLAKADIIIHHNGDRFDVRKLNARLIYHGLEPLPPLVTVDTLKEVKKIAQFTSNRLDYLGQHLCGEGKIHTSPDLWLKVIYNDKKALNEMVTYNEQDVLLLEKVYDRLLPHMKKHPHIGVMQGGQKCDCPKCGSINLIKKGTRVLATGVIKQQLQCGKCGSYHQINFKPD